MNKPVRITLAVLALAGVGVAVQQKRAAAGVPQAKPATLPLTCRLRGHGWKLPRNGVQGPIRTACQRCQRIDVPMPR